MKRYSKESIESDTCTDEKLKIPPSEESSVMNNSNVTSLVWIKNVCDSHNKPNVVACICGSVVKWNCVRCGKTQKTNPHYAEHCKCVCERCEV